MAVIPLYSNNFVPVKRQIQAHPTFYSSPPSDEGVNEGDRRVADAQHNALWRWIKFFGRGPEDGEALV